MKTLAPITIGYDHDHRRRAEVPVPGDRGGHWLIGGASGGGKSQAIHATLAQLAERAHMALCVNDAALMDYIDWTPRVSCMALGKQGGAWLLEQAEQEMLRRLRLGRRLGVNQLVPGPDLPYIVYVFDELAMLMLAKDIKGASDRLVEAAQVFRKTAQGLILCTQHPKATVVPTMLRGQCAVRLCLRTKEKEATDAILDTQRIPAHELPFDTPGVGFVELPTGQIVKIRVPYVDQAEARRTAEATAHLTPKLDPADGWREVFDPYEEGDSV